MVEFVHWQYGQSPTTFRDWCARACLFTMVHAALPTVETVRTEAASKFPARRKSLALAGIAAVLWLGLRFLSTYHIAPRQPSITDEFCYLLGAETFLHGRLTNPTPVMARFFESPMLLIHPTYASKYPPGESAWLALGKRLFGTTNAGLILQGFCLIFVLALMFCAWTSLPIAALLTFVSGICLLPPLSIWTNWYFGAGCATAMGAACVLLGLGWFVRSGKTAAAGLMMAFGAVQLSLNRPYEGAVFCLTVLAITPWLARRARGVDSRELVRLAAWAAPVLVLGIGVNLVYNKAVTGNALQLPYLLQSKQYAVATPFCFVPARKTEPNYPNARLKATYAWDGFEGQSYTTACSPRLWFAYSFVDTAVLLFRLLLPIVPVLLLIPLCWRALWTRALLIIAGLAFVSNAIEVWRNTHYLAASFVAILLLSACILDENRRFAGLTPSLRRGLAGSLVALTLIYFVTLERYGFPAQPPQSFGLRRAAVQNRLKSLSGEQLVIVHYPDPNACTGEEWVYNGPDPDHEKVVWAHDLGPALEPELLSYYAGRQKWLLTADCTFSELRPLPQPPQAAASEMRNIIANTVISPDAMMKAKIRAAEASDSSN